MNLKKKPVDVTLTRERRKSQQWGVRIDRPGRSEAYDMKQRYADDSNARRGARRNLNAVKIDGVWYWPDGRGNAHPIKFTIKRK